MFDKEGFFSLIIGLAWVIGVVIFLFGKSCNYISSENDFEEYLSETRWEHTLGLGTPSIAYKFDSDGTCKIWRWDYFNGGWNRTDSIESTCLEWTVHKGRWRGMQSEEDFFYVKIFNSNIDHKEHINSHLVYIDGALVRIKANGIPLNWNDDGTLSIWNHQLGEAFEILD